MKEEKIHRCWLERRDGGGARRDGRRKAKRWVLNINQGTGCNLIPLNWVESNAFHRIISVHVSELGKRLLPV